MEEIKKEKTLVEKVDESYEVVKAIKEGKVRKFRMPRRGKVSKRQSRKGYSTICKIDDNGNVDFEKRPIEDSTYRLKSGTYHTIDVKDANLTYKGKPFIIQPEKKLNPYNPLSGRNETYDQKYVMARMLGDAIKLVGKKKGGAFLWIIAGIIIIGIIYFVIKNKHVVGA